MSPRVMQLLLGLSLLLNCFVLAGFVYRSWIAPPIFETRLPPPPPPPGARPSPIEAVLHDLGVDSGQRESLRGVLDGYATTRRERLREIQKVREQSAAELKQPQIDLAKVDGLIDRLARLRADLQKENLRTAIQLGPALRPDQRERLRVLIAERFAGAPPPPPRPPGAPGAPGGRPPGPGKPPQ
ncbi:MAG: periplasmic heavy metal sensor [Rhodospirillales bacterium]|nr:periplasmic heavy metal sensor [Rhodospirillales bacterium]